MIYSIKVNVPDSSVLFVRKSGTCQDGHVSTEIQSLRFTLATLRTIFKGTTNHVIMILLEIKALLEQRCLANALLRNPQNETNLLDLEI